MGPSRLARGVQGFKDPGPLARAWVGLGDCKHKRPTTGRMAGLHGCTSAQPGVQDSTPMFLASSLVGALPQRAPSLLLAPPFGRGSGAVPPPQAGEGWGISACGLLGFASRKGKRKVGWRVVEASTRIYKVGTRPHPSLLLAGGRGQPARLINASRRRGCPTPLPLAGEGRGDSRGEGAPDGLVVKLGSHRPCKAEDGVRLPAGPYVPVVQRKDAGPRSQQWRFDSSWGRS